MKTIVTLLVALVVLAGCNSDYRPNTQKGHHLDEINKHTQHINRLDFVIYDQSLIIEPMKTEQSADVTSFQTRMRAKMSKMKGRQ